MLHLLALLGARLSGYQQPECVNKSAHRNGEVARVPDFVLERVGFECTSNSRSLSAACSNIISGEAIIDIVATSLV
jgi:hypothetical protein